MLCDALTGLKFVRFLTQPEVKFGSCKRLKRGEKKTLFNILFTSRSHEDSIKQTEKIKIAKRRA